MSNSSREIQVNWLRLQWTDDGQTIMYQAEDIRVIREKDEKTLVEYLLVTVRGKTKFEKQLKTCQWLVDSSKEGVAAIECPTAKLVIKYNETDRRQLNFFDDLERVLEKKRADNQPPQRRRNSRSPQPTPQGQRYRSPPRQPTPPRVKEKRWTTADLVDAISRGSRKDAELAAAFLAKSRSEVPLGLIDEQVLQAKGRPNPNSLQLKLRIEHHNSREPVIKTIHVPKNMTLASLKAQIEDETDVRQEDQFWFAGEQHLINDEYKFGSGDPVVLDRRTTRRVDDQRNSAPTIRSGDTVILYIASLTPMTC